MTYLEPIGEQFKIRQAERELPCSSYDLATHAVVRGGTHSAEVGAAMCAGAACVLFFCARITYNVLGLCRGLFEVI